MKEKYELILRTISNPTRIDILEFLSNDGGKRFQDIRQEFSLNPNSVNYHLKKLVKTNLVIKKKKYHITKFGEKTLTIAGRTLIAIRKELRLK